MSKRVIILNFPEESQSYQAFSEIKQLHMTKKIKGEQMAVVTHEKEKKHPFKMNDFIDFTGNDHNAKDSMIGMFLGILAGPLGILLGWITGSAIGSMQDAKEINAATSAFEHVINQIKVGETGVLLLAYEEDNRAMNDLVLYQLGGQLIRLDYEEVMQEIVEATQLEKQVKNDAKEHWKNRNSVSDKKEDTQK